jgi:hypothetical protein
MSIECLTGSAQEAPDPEEILERIDHMAHMPVRAHRVLCDAECHQGEGCVNTFDPVVLGGSFTRQDLSARSFIRVRGRRGADHRDRASKARRYWNFSSNGSLFQNAVEYVYRLSSTTGHFAEAQLRRQIPRGHFASDPGVPNWLDPAGFQQGTIYGRWYDCDSLAHADAEKRVILRNP